MKSSITNTRDELKTGTAVELFGLTPVEDAFIDIKASLATCLRRERLKGKISQAELARRIGSSQSRITKAENMDPSIGVQFLMKALLGSGVTRQRIGAIIATNDPNADVTDKPKQSRATSDKRIVFLVDVEPEKSAKFKRVADTVDVTFVKAGKSADSGRIAARSKPRDAKAAKSKPRDAKATDATVRKAKNAASGRDLTKSESQQKTGRPTK